RERQLQFLGRDLGQRGDDALPQLDLACEDRRAAVGTDSDPGIELAVVLQAAGQPLLCKGELRVEREGNDERAEAGGEFASIERGNVHLTSSRSPGPRAAPP